MIYSNVKLPPEDQLLTREEFDKYVKLRSKGLCVICPLKAVDSHHVLDRKLFPDGGYYLGNGAAVCEEHHWEVEVTTISVEDIRILAGIKNPVLPPGFLPNLVYDKWGNLVMGDNTRVSGPLKDDTGMQKALKQGNVYWKLHL